MFQKHLLHQKLMTGLCLLLLMTLIFSQATSSARADGALLISEAYWVDESGSASFDEARNAPYQHYEGSLTQGYKPYALWLKLRIRGQPETEQLALVVRPAFLRKIELYDPALGTAEPLVSGRDAQITATNHIGLDNGFVIPAREQDRDVFVRVTTTTTLTTDVDVAPLKSTETRGRITAGVAAFYFAFLLAFCLWGIVSWIIRRDLIYALFSLRQLVSAAHLFVWFGLLRYFLSDVVDSSTRDVIYNSVIVATVAVACLFDFRLIADFGIPRWLRNYFWLYVGLSAACFGMLFLGFTQPALLLNSIAAVVFLVSNAIITFFVKVDRDQPYGRLTLITLRAGFLLMAAVVILPTLMYQNVAHLGVPLLKVVFFHAVISTIILFTILTIRGRQRDLAAQASLMQYAVKERELKQESERRMEKERFLSMLTHEIRNPLSVIRLLTQDQTAAGKSVQKAAQEISQLIERVEQTERLEDAGLQTSVTAVNARALIDEVVSEHLAAPRCDVSGPSDLILQTDEDLLRSILRNLLDNAAKYSPDGSRILVNLAGQALSGTDGVEFNVLSQAGDAGLPDVERLFSKYYRSKGAHRHPGSGLGLFLVAGWLKALGGTISYTPIEQADGTVLVKFSVWLPG